MEPVILNKNNQQELGSLFETVFTTSDGEQEGRLVGDLASQLAEGLDDETIIGFGASDNNSIIGAIFFTRLEFADGTLVYMLAPVAVATAYQQQGVGKALIQHGLEQLASRSVDVVVTYGDPAYYSKLGFQPLSEKEIRAPLELSMPEGWQGQSLTEQSVPTLQGRPACVKQFNNPVYW